MSLAAPGSVISYDNKPRWIGVLQIIENVCKRRNVILWVFHKTVLFKGYVEKYLLLQQIAVRVRQVHQRQDGQRILGDAGHVI